MSMGFWYKLGIVGVILGAGLWKAWPRIWRQGLTPMFLVRVVVGIACLAMTFTIGSNIEGGCCGADGSGQRIVAVVLMMGSMVYGVILLATLPTLTGAEGMLPVWPLRLIAWCLVIGFGLIALGLWIQERTGFEVPRTLLAALGAAIMVVTIARPAWFWEHPKARALRSHVGDRATIVIYLGVGAAICGIALFGSR